MKFYLLFGFLFPLFSLPFHDISIAIFNLEVEESKVLKMTVQFDKVDLAKAMKLTDRKAISTDIASQYLNKNSQWTINGKVQQLQICSSWEEADHFFLEVIFPSAVTTFSTMTIQNSCLVQEIDNHSNIIYLNYRGKLRGFRLSKKRRSTKFNFE